MSKLIFKYENEEYIVYENEEYTVKICDDSGWLFKRNGSRYVPYDYDKEDGEWIKTDDIVKLKITNRKTGKNSQKTCYQGRDEVIRDLNYDLEHGKRQFKKIFDKIDA